MKMSGMNVSLDTMLMAMMVDSLATLVWTKTDDCAKRMNRPKSMVQLLLNSHDEETETFDTAEDFEKARLEIIRS